MHLRRLLVPVGFLVAAAFAPAAETKPAPAAALPPLPVETLFGNPQIRAPQLSPDGTKIAFLFPVEGRLAIGLFDLKTKEARMVVRGQDESIQQFFWKGNSRLVFAADVGGNESPFIASTDLTGKKIIRIADSQEDENRLFGTSAGIVDTLRFDPDHIVLAGVFSAKDEHAMLMNASYVATRLNVTNKARSDLMTFESGDQDVMVDNAGAVRLKQRSVRRELSWHLRSADHPAFQEIESAPIHGYAETWDPQVFAADNETLYVISREEHDRGALYAYNTRTQTRGEAIFVPPAGEIDHLVLSYDRSKLYGVAYEDEKVRYHWFDPERAHLQAMLDNTFPGETVNIVSTSSDEQVNLVLVRSDRDPGTYYFFDRKAGALTPFKRIREIDPARLQPMTPITFAARDGLELHGYLTLPAGAAGRRVPLIMHPHGGPFGVRDSWGYDPEVQFLASRGYAVLQVNYRGSGGYGREFIDKGRFQWGRAMQDDLTDGVKWAIAQGIADPKRIAIYGASYGGYAALAGVELTPDLYCCAVNYVGAADLAITFAPNKAFQHDEDFDYQKTWVGPDRAYLDATSPILMVDRIRVPTLHAYGDKDPRVKIKHWDRLEAQLKKYHKPYVSIEEEHQGHGFRDAKASVNFYTAMEKFFAENLAPERP